MATTTQQRVRGRPAHPPGVTALAYTPNGKKLITVGANDVIRVYTTGSTSEPRNIDMCPENNLAVAATNDFFIVGSEDGSVSMYALSTCSFDKLLTRCSVPIRDLALSPDGQWAAVASDETEVKIVDTRDMTNVLFLRDQPKPIKHLTFHPSGSYIAASCTDGIVYVYSTSTTTPELVQKVDGLIRPLETDAEASSCSIWHPDGRALAAPTATRDIQVMSRSDWEKQRAFSGGHMGDITALAWSPNGALLATAGADRKILLWETKTQKIVARYDYAGVTNFVWHSYENIVSFTTSEGELFIYENFVAPNSAGLLEDALHPAPFVHDPLAETSGNARKALTNGHKFSDQSRSRRRGSLDTVDDILGPDMDLDNDDFVEDDDGAGYTDGLNVHGKRTNGHLDELDGFDGLNLTGFVWTVDQDTHHTVTVEFYDREFHRDFHFTDPYLYDKACLNENGTLFSCPPVNGNPATIFYRPHETWTARADWRTELPHGEDITSISLSDSYVTVTTTTNYVRVFTLFGTPFRVYRQKSSPTVTCASWRDYILTMGNGPVGGDGSTTLLYTIENIKRDEICQSEDIVALSEGASIKNVLFSDNGDPCIYDSTGVLLVLQHWRTPGQARWVPMLDTKLLERLAGGRKEETYWPVAVAQDKFHCIILKGGDQYPYFPKPLLSEFDFRVPCSINAAENDEESTAHEGPRLEEAYVRGSLMLSLLEDLLAATKATHSQRAELNRRETEVDKALLQLLNVECRAGEERGMKALEIVGLMRDRGGKMIELAGKIADRFGRTVIKEKIDELAEKRLMGIEDEDS
ncbi:mitochondrial escape protein 2 [Physcia stellaris]|nr:mitochondrial escape protein 2 [Physcia stellaris]